MRRTLFDGESGFVLECFVVLGLRGVFDTGIADRNINKRNERVGEKIERKWGYIET